MLFLSVFLKTHKKSYLPQKTAKIAFLTVNNFYCPFSKYTDQKNICASIKSQSEPKHKEQFFGGPKYSIAFKTQFQICFSAFVLLCKRKHHANFHKKILIFGHPGFFENENFEVRALARPSRACGIFLF